MIFFCFISAFYVCFQFVGFRFSYSYSRGRHSVSSNQYSATDNYKLIDESSGGGLPGAFFFYEISPILVKIEEGSQSFGKFLVHVRSLSLISNYPFSVPLCLPFCCVRLVRCLQIGPSPSQTSLFTLIFIIYNCVSFVLVGCAASCAPSSAALWRWPGSLIAASTMACGEWNRTQASSANYM